MEMTPEQQEEFVDLVKNMRHNQRRFKNLGRKEAKDASEKLEAKVDEFLSILTSTQQKLWE